MSEFLNKLKLRWKLLSLVLPLVIIPIFVVAGVIGYIANLQAYLGITQTSKDDLQHMVSFTIDLLDFHDRHYRNGLNNKSAFSTSELESEAFSALKEKIKNKKVGNTGYIFCMNSTGTLTIHPDAEGTNIFDARDSSGFPFIREMCLKKSGWIRYPWQNIGSVTPRMKIVHYEYFKPYDWIVAVGSYEDEFYSEA
ncbi:MAG: Cache 3/Cache 2 fusion domain-containing protein, partial [Deltaproteobacteria bacterium]